MSERRETVHVVFGWSAAETLRQVMSTLGIAARVIALPEMLSVGPINPPDANLRLEWGKSVLGVEGALRDQPDRMSIDPKEAWLQATDPGVAPVFWVCLSNPAEHACLLAFASRMHDRPFDLIDATSVEIATSLGVQRPASLGMLRVQDIIAANLYGRQRPTSLEERRDAVATWSRLQLEDAPFRIVRNGRLVSAPLTHYDTLLIEEARSEWEIAISLIGRAMTSFSDAASGDATGDDVLFGRLLALGEAGEVEIEGPGPGMRDYHVRRSARDRTR